ncbi:citrate synthase 4, mitochondrial [Iris pallida]|uniref:Citrate synthase 4, mitochondrial n=1 Tax=Iris pallida TaxID=29817 RepID=A0AAX6G8Z9_IRIPA|nr:citrate synthase 4, mitochondrial [Iris pallida]
MAQIGPAAAGMLVGPCNVAGTVETSSTTAAEVEPTGSATVVDGSMLVATTTVRRTAVDCSCSKVAEESTVAESTSTTRSQRAEVASGTAGTADSSRMERRIVENNHSPELAALAVPVAPWPEYNKENRLLPLISSQILLRAIDQIY